MRLWEESTWASGMSEGEVIGRVGGKIAARVRELVQPGERVLLLAGRGHNGDDVRAALPLLGDLDARMIRVMDPVEALAELRRELGGERRPSWMVDGIFGLGLNRDLAGEWVELVEALNGSGIPMVAVDVPSGLDADTGKPRGTAIRATLTLTVGAPKVGLVADWAAEWVGRLEVMGEVGLRADPMGSIAEEERGRGGVGGAFPWRWTEAEDFLGFPRRRLAGAHKGTFGHVAMIAGSLGYHGAAVLAARGAAKARPGLITVFTSPETYGPVAGQLAAPMVSPWSEGMELPVKTTALLVGPGLAGGNIPGWLRERIVGWWSSLPLPMVADASALDWLAGVEPCRGALRVITPHLGEARRMLERRGAAVAGDRGGMLEALAVGGMWVVLKGNQTLVGNGEGPIYVNSSGNPGLAQGGSGDGLAGFLAGLLAQPNLVAEPLLAMRYAVWEHGAAADRLEAGGGSWTVEDLVGSLGRRGAVRVEGER